MYIGEEKLDDFNVFCQEFGLELTQLIDNATDNEFKIRNNDLWIEVQFLNDYDICFFVDRVQNHKHSVPELDFYVKINPNNQNVTYYINETPFNPENIGELKEIFLSCFS